ncbi:MAG: hypothetical protein M0Z61_04740 [Nitrospiraceae bacterium]|nr:hypothetical protein [Nitrospiraceae bacterium]
MADFIDMIKKQSEKRIADVRELTGKLSEQLKHLIKMIPEETRNKSIETFLNDIRKGVLGEKTVTRRAARKGRKPYARRGRKPGKAASEGAAVSAGRAAGRVKTAVKRGRRKKETVTAENGQKSE